MGWMMLSVDDQAERPDGGRPARYVCPNCGVGDYVYTRPGQPCVYCVDGRVVDRLRLFGLPVVVDEDGPRFGDPGSIR
jgi:hypothetical protein